MIYRNAPLIFLVVCGFILFIFYTADDQSPITSPLQSQKFLQLPPKLMTQGNGLLFLVICTETDFLRTFLSYESIVTFLIY